MHDTHTKPQPGFLYIYATSRSRPASTVLGGFSELRGRHHVCPSRAALNLVEAALPTSDQAASKAGGVPSKRRKVCHPWPRGEGGTHAARCTQHKEARQIEGKGANDKHENRLADTFELRRQTKQCTPRRPA